MLFIWYIYLFYYCKVFPKRIKTLCKVEMAEFVDNKIPVNGIPNKRWVLASYKCFALE